MGRGGGPALATRTLPARGLELLLRLPAQRLTRGDRRLSRASGLGTAAAPPGLGGGAPGHPGHLSERPRSRRGWHRPWRGLVAGARAVRRAAAPALLRRRAEPARHPLCPPARRRALRGARAPIRPDLHTPAHRLLLSLTASRERASGPRSRRGPGDSVPRKALLPRRARSP